MFAARPEKVIEMAVKRMLPKNKLGRHMILRLKVVRGPEHEYKAQKPEELKIAAAKLAIRCAARDNCFRKDSRIWQRQRKQQ